jgi:hypothetical protein
MSPETVEMQRRAVTATASRTTLNEEDRSIEVCWTTGAAVKRYSYEEGGYYMEELQVDKKAIRLDRFNAMSLLDTHERESMDQRLGTVVPGSLRIDGGKGYVRVKFSRKQRADDVFQDLLDGHPLPISVGYKIHQYEKTDGADGKLPVLRAIDWEPFELSAVAVPADAGAVSRSEEETMSHHVRRAQTFADQPPQEPDPAAQRAADEAANRKMTVREARGFVAELATSIGNAEDVAELQAHITRGMSENEVRAALFEIMVKRQNATPTFPHVETRGMQDAQETTRRLVANAIMHRHGSVDKLEDGANQYRGMTTVELARDLLRQRGENHRGGPAEVLKRALHSTSDFPIILGDVAQQTVLASYRKPNNTFQLIAKENLVSDLREVKVIDVGSAPDLKKVMEHGEYTAGTFKDAAEGMTIAKYGRKFGFTLEMLINDQLNIFMQLVANWSQKAAKLEGDLAWAAIIDNAKLKDDKGLFHADHGNLAATGTALDKTNLIAARLAFRQQKDIDGEPTDVAPKYLFTGSALEIDAQNLIAAAHVPATVTDTIPQAIKSLVPIYEPRLDKIATKAWFLFAGQEDTQGRGLQYARLLGHEAPQIEEQKNFDVDGIEFKIRHFFGVGLTDYRFAYKNPGL